MKVKFQIETKLEIDDEMEVPKEVVARGEAALYAFVKEQVEMSGTHGLNIVMERIDWDALNLYGPTAKKAASAKGAGSGQEDKGPGGQQGHFRASEDAKGDSPLALPPVKFGKVRVHATANGGTGLEPSGPQVKEDK